MSALVSIIVPVYNAEKLLKRAVECFLAQTYKNIEVLLIDDGSVDGSAEIGRGYAKKDREPRRCRGAKHRYRIGGGRVFLFSRRR